MPAPDGCDPSIGKPLALAAPVAASQLCATATSPVKPLFPSPIKGAQHDHIGYSSVPSTPYYWGTFVGSYVCVTAPSVLGSLSQLCHNGPCPYCHVKKLPGSVTIKRLVSLRVFAPPGGWDLHQQRKKHVWCFIQQLVVWPFYCRAILMPKKSNDLLLPHTRMMPPT